MYFSVLSDDFFSKDAIAFFRKFVSDPVSQGYGKAT